MAQLVESARIRAISTLALASLLTAACGSGDDTPGGPDAGPTADADLADADLADAGPDLTEAMFDPDRVLDISIDMAPDDWDSLRTQTRSIFDILGSSCLVEPPERPFTYFPATITIDGDVVENVAVRKKGFFGSLSTTKPSLKVKFNEYVEGAEYFGLKRLTLNNSISDPSYVKQCIGYWLFREAGVPASRCNFATVKLNGEDLGIYVHIESLKKQFLRRHFGNDDGNMYEGALSDFRPGWIETFQKKTNKLEPDRSDIEALVPAVEAPDVEFLDAIEPLVDIDSFIDMWATELLVMHADGYARNTNNFYMYRDPATQQFVFIPWGIDSILFPDTQISWEDQMPPKTVWAEGALSRRLYLLPETRTRYLGRLRELLDTVWNEEVIHAELDRMEALVRPLVTEEETEQFDFVLTMVRDFVDARRGELEPVLAGAPELWDRPLRDPWCIDAIGTVEASFSTTWGTLQDEDVFASGTGTMNVVADGVPFVTGQVGSHSGLEPEEGVAVIQLFSWLDDGTLLVLHLVLDPALVQPGTLEVDWIEVSAQAVKIEFPPVGEPEAVPVGLVGDGTLVFTAASTSDGAPVSGTVSTLLYEPF